MPDVWLTVLVALTTMVAMEPWSRIVHQHLWHRSLYTVHKTHHPTPGMARPTLEANDAFVLMHAAPAMALVAAGWFGWVEGVAGQVLLGMGIGMTLFGLAYTIVHDGLAHGRLPVAFLARSRWLRRIRAAHEIHHRDGGPPYGFFAGPRELKAATRKNPDRFSRPRAR